MRSHLSPRTILAGVLAVAAILAVEGLLYLAGGPLYVIVFTLAFVVGAAIIPLWAYGLHDAIPLASPMLGKLLFTLGMTALQTAVLSQRADNSYRIEPADADSYGPAGYWQRFALGWLGITYERDPDAYGDAVIETDVSALSETDPADLPGERASVDIRRGGKRSYIRTDTPDDALYIAIGEKLAELKDSAGLGIPNRVQLEALKNYGGDAGQYTVTEMGAITFAFAVLGSGLGYAIFFMGGA